MPEFIPNFDYQMNAENRIEIICAVCWHVVARTDDELLLKTLEGSHECVQLLLPHAS
jgi:hypothetical protein